MTPAMPIMRRLLTSAVMLGSMFLACSVSQADQAGTSAIPTQADAKRQAAFKLAGLVVFVANACPKLKPDYGKFDNVLHALGIEKATLEEPAAKSEYLAYTTAYNRDVGANCEKAAQEFGASGRTLPGLLIKMP